MPPPGPKLPFIQHIWEPVTAVYQPFCVRLMTTLFNLIAYAFLTAWGFQRRTHNSVSFWISRPSWVVDPLGVWPRHTS